MHPQMPARVRPQASTIRFAAVGATPNPTKIEAPPMTAKPDSTTSSSAAPGAAADPPADSLPVGEYAALIGLDWGDEKHALALCARGREHVETATLAAAPEVLHAWLEQLAQRFQGQPVAVGVEASKGAIVSALREYPWDRDL